MATTSATTPVRQPVHRGTSDDCLTSSSAGVSPADSPHHSASSTSLSSLSETEPKSEFGKLIDTHGNVFEVPDYTIKQIFDAIPKHCFERSAFRSLSYVFRDIACLATTFYLFHTYLTPDNIPSMPVRATLWGVYTFVQGLFATGIWVLAHECGHHAFSQSKILNDTVGWTLHSSLLVPYFSWKISHSKHHKGNGHMERDMVFVPCTRDQASKRRGKKVEDLAEMAEEAPIVTLISLIGRQLIGWPEYLMTNVSGHNCHERQREGRGKGKANGFGGGVNHFDPRSPLFEAKDAKWIVLSDIGLAIVGFVLYQLGNTFGWQNMLVWYFIPYLWVNHWLVAITFLQHTDPSLPHYKPESWTFVRGAAATIDRDFGFIGRHLFHGIIETHVLHHYVSTIPFYNADEASEAIKPVMGKHYRSDVKGGPVGFLRAMWRSARMCQWVEPTEGAKGKGRGILFFRNHNGIGVKPANM